MAHLNMINRSWQAGCSLMFLDFFGIQACVIYCWTIEPRKVVRERRPFFCLIFFSVWLGVFVHAHVPWEVMIIPVTVFIHNHGELWIKSLKAKKLLFVSDCYIDCLSDSSPNTAIGCRNRAFLLSECSFKANHCGNVNNNGELCINALRAEMMCFHFWLLRCLPMVMTVPMSQSEMKAELFCLQSDDAKLAIVKMVWMFRN